MKPVWFHPFFRFGSQKNFVRNLQLGEAAAKVAMMGLAVASMVSTPVARLLEGVFAWSPSISKKLHALGHDVSFTPLPSTFSITGEIKFQGEELWVDIQTFGMGLGALIAFPLVRGFKKAAELLGFDDLAAVLTRAEDKGMVNPQET